MRIRELINLVEHFGVSRTFYHVTLVSNLTNISEYGLMPSVGDRSRQLGESSAIFLFPDQDSAEDAVSGWLGDQLDEDEPLALLEVHVPEDIEILKTDGVDWEIYVKAQIPPNCIKVISRDF